MPQNAPSSTAQLPALVFGLRHSGLVERSRRTLVAVSGGPDSTALLDAMREDGYDVVAAHYDHALQPSSSVAAQHVHSLCEQLGVQLLVERRQNPLPKGSVQAAARTLRYEFLERARVAAAADVVAVAHTADDQVEGVVLHLMRGCGLAGMRGMPARRGPVVRPLLGVSRADVLDFLRVRGIHALEDPANANRAFARVRVRRDVLPALERDRPGITRRFQAAAIRATAMQDGVESAAVHLLTGGAKRPEVARAPEPVAAEAMRILYAMAGGAQPALSRAHVRAMLRLAQPGRGGRGVDLPGALRLRIVGETMEIVTGRPGPVATPRLEVQACAGCDDRRAVHLKPGLDLRLGYRQPGLRMRPLGGAGTRKLQDIFVDARVPREERDAWPLLFSGEWLAAVMGIAVDARLASRPGEPSLHVTITGMDGRSRKKPVLESPDSPPGEPN